MNFTKPNITTYKNQIIIAGAVTLCILIAAGVYFSLRTVAPRTNGLVGEQQPANNGSAPTTPAQQADTAFKAGTNALKAGKTEEAIVQFNTAKELYEQIGDTTRVEQTVDVISYAEQEAKIEKEQGQTGGGGTGTGESGDKNGNGIIDGDEQAPPQHATVQGDKATSQL